MYVQHVTKLINIPEGLQTASYSISVLLMHLTIAQVSVI